MGGIRGGTPGQRGCSECTASDPPSPSVCTPGRSGREWRPLPPASCAPRRSGRKCAASSAREPVRPMHRTEHTGYRDALHSPTAPVHPQRSPPDGHHRGHHSPSEDHSPPSRRSAPGGAVESPVPTHPQQRPRTERHRFGRPPGYCRERERRRTGGGFGDGPYERLVSLDARLEGVRGSGARRTSGLPSGLWFTVARTW